MASRSIPLISNVGGDSEDGDEDINNSKTSSHSSTHYCKQFIGIEISQERADEARSNIQHAQETNQIPSHVLIEIICANALDTNSIDYSRATVIFLYLVPRGLRLIKPIIWPKEAMPDNRGQAVTQTELIIQQKSKKHRRIITYMSPFEDEVYVRKELCRVDHQVGSAWPIYLYHAT